MVRFHPGALFSLLNSCLAGLFLGAGAGATKKGLAWQQVLVVAFFAFWAAKLKLVALVYFAAVAGEEGLVGVEVDCVRQECYRAVAAGKHGSARVVAAERQFQQVA